MFELAPLLGSPLPSSPSPSSSPGAPPLYWFVPGRYLYVGGNVTGASVHPLNALPLACSETSWSLANKLSKLPAAIAARTTSSGRLRR